MTDVIAGRFALHEPIAQGGSGVVWRAFDGKRGEFCALKVLRRRDAGALLRFVREQSVRLSHPHVLTPYSWAAEDDHVAIASELLDGGSLTTLIGDYGPLAESTVSVILGQLLEALAFVHDAGLVHRDVKPANVLLHATGTGPVHLRLSDFGLAVREADARLTQHGTVVGTPGYLAPEARHGVAPDARQDLFAAGQVALALLIGCEPDAPRPASAAQGRPQVGELIAALVDPDPSARPPSAARARALLGTGSAADTSPHTADGEPVDVLHQLPIPAPQAPPRRRSWRMRAGLAALAVAVTVAALVAVLATLGSPDTSPGREPGRGSDAPGTDPSVGSTATASPPTQSTAAPGTAGSGQLRAGDPCGWQQQGDVRSAADGTPVVCTLRNGDYVWLAG